MAQAVAQIQPRPFSGWLRDVCEQVGIEDFPQLHWLLIRSGIGLRERTVERWWNGQAEPPARQQQAILTVLDRAFPEMKVWEQFAEAMQQQRFDLGPIERGATRAVQMPLVAAVRSVKD